MLKKVDDIILYTVVLIDDHVSIKVSLSKMGTVAPTKKEYVWLCMWVLDTLVSIGDNEMIKKCKDAFFKLTLGYSRIFWLS